VTILLTDALIREARALGFDSLGITDPDAIAGVRERLDAFLAAGAHGQMDWLADNPGRRADPKVMWADVRSVIMLGVNYGPDQNPLAILAQRSHAAISVYAQGDDYHDLIKKRLKPAAASKCSSIPPR
jgi:epoxyqueuosine reductase